MVQNWSTALTDMTDVKYNARCSADMRWMTLLPTGCQGLRKAWSMLQTSLLHHDIRVMQPMLCRDICQVSCDVADYNLYLTWSCLLP